MGLLEFSFWFIYIFLFSFREILIIMELLLKTIKHLTKLSLNKHLTANDGYKCHDTIFACSSSC